jgi:hypothetical protein
MFSPIEDYSGKTPKVLISDLKPPRVCIEYVLQIRVSEVLNLLTVVRPHYSRSISAEKIIPLDHQFRSYRRFWRMVGE